MLGRLHDLRLASTVRLLKQRCLPNARVEQEIYILNKNNHQKRKRCSLKDNNSNLQTSIRVKSNKKDMNRKIRWHNCVQ